MIGLLFAAAAFAFEVPGFELVYTAPAETAMLQPDLRGTTEVWVEMIGRAKRTIDFEQMSVNSKPGEKLETVIEALEAAAARGVKIRFLLEEKMLRPADADTVARLSKIKNLELRVQPFSKISPGGLGAANFFVVDGKEAFLGSQHFDWRSLQHSQETGLRITDTRIAGGLQGIFWRDWAGKGGGSASKLAGKGRAFLVASPSTPGIPSAEAELVRLIESAKKEIRVQLLSYAPLGFDGRYYGVIDQALRAASARGVRIMLLVSHWNQAKPAIDHLKSLSLIPGVAVSIVTVPMAKGGKIPFARVIHSSYMVVDDSIAWLGTSDWRGGYFQNFRGVEVVVKDEALARRLATMHQQLWISPYGASLDILKEYPEPNRGD